MLTGGHCLKQVEGKEKRAGSLGTPGMVLRESLLPQPWCERVWSSQVKKPVQGAKVEGKCPFPQCAKCPVQLRLGEAQGHLSPSFPAELWPSVPASWGFYAAVL